MLYLATDHRGLKLKNQLKTWLSNNKILFKDLGAYEYNQDDDYPDFAKLLSEKVLEDEKNKGIIFCGSGAGVSIACNKIKGIYSAIGFNHRQVKSFTEHDNVNVLAISSDETKKFKCFQLVKTFLNSQYQGLERQQRRLDKIKALEK